MTNDEETEQFIQTQKDLKHKKIQEHADQLEHLFNEREQALERTTSEVERAKLIQEKELEQQRETLSDKVPYRNVDVINRDYQQLVEKERGHITGRIKDYANFVKKQQESHIEALKETNAWIKSTIKPYKSYIRKASRGLNAEKRERTRKHKRALKKALSDAEHAFQPQL